MYFVDLASSESFDTGQVRLRVRVRVRVRVRARARVRVRVRVRVSTRASESFDTGQVAPSGAGVPDAGSSSVGLPAGFSPEGSQFGLHALGKVLTARP